MHFKGAHAATEQLVAAIHPAAASPEALHTYLLACRVDQLLLQAQIVFFALMITVCAHISVSGPQVFISEIFFL